MLQYVDDLNGDWNGCYMYEDVTNEGCIRAGSMARKVTSNKEKKHTINLQ